jgi:protein TonB
MRQGAALSYPLSLAMALCITIAIFLLMYTLIHNDSTSDDAREQLPLVEIFEPEDKPDMEEKPEPEPEPEPVEPMLPELDVQTPVSSPAPILDMPVAAMDIGEVDIPSAGNWRPPAVGQVATGEGETTGKGNRGYKTIIPIATRQPNIPKIAWDNKVDGWVLVSFVLYNNGKVGNIRVMDAQPRGVFEENVIASIEKWRYSPFEGPPIQLTQRVELFYKDYPNNIRQLR